MKSYRKAAVASTFSPTHRSVLAEADAFARHVGASLDVLHAAPHSAETERRFRESLTDLGREAYVHWLPGDSPAESLLDGARELSFDVVIAGALEREPEAEERAFTGSVARRFLSEAPCDLLLLPRPEEDPRPIESGLFAVQPGTVVRQFVETQAKALQLDHVILVVSETPFARAIAASKGEAALNTREWADRLADELKEVGVSAESSVIDSNTGFGLCEAARGFNADLMVVQAAARGGRHQLPAHLDWLNQVIPTRFLLCREHATPTEND